VNGFYETKMDGRRNMELVQSTALDYRI